MKLKRAFTFPLVFLVTIVCVVTFMNFEGLYFMIFMKKGVSQLFNIISLRSITGTIQPTSKVYLNVIPKVPKKHVYTKGILRSKRRNLTIYLRYPGDSVTDTVLLTSEWEPHLLHQVEDYIYNHTGVQVLDIGCNLGVYTLVAAAVGGRVVAVDANPNNTARLVQSLLANGLEGQTTILLNAFSNEKDTFETDFVARNVGGSHIMEAKSSSISVNAIFIDDLVPLFDEIGEVIIKMNIKIDIKRASRFFSHRIVSMVLMNWEYIKKMEHIQSVIDFFVARQYRPFPDSSRIRGLNVLEYLSWPVNVFWLR